MDWVKGCNPDIDEQETRCDHKDLGREERALKQLSALIVIIETDVQPE